MSDFLAYVERNYGCVPEYNRCQEEKAQLEYERWERDQEYYRKNELAFQKADADGTLVHWAFECVDCKDYTPIGMRDAEDDVEHGICGNLSCTDCEYRKKERIENDPEYCE